MALEDLRSVRLAKLKVLEEKGINPYPAGVKQDRELVEVVTDFNKLAKSGKSLTLVGRVMSLRAQGAIIFFHFDDGTGRLQGFLKKGDKISDEDFNLFTEVVDVGDFVEVKGTLFLTKRKEKTLHISKWRMAAKSLRPLPEKWHGLQDVEERFRKRYLDTLMNEDVRERFLTRTRIVSEIRKILDGAGYVEVETPALQPIYGGASAEPFVTHHNALDVDLYLRISDELYLKRLLVGGFPKVYEIARDFRNEGIDVTHNPEFTMLEFYEAYSDADKQMAFVEKMLRAVVKSISKSGKIEWNGETINFGKKFAVSSYYDLLKHHALVPNPESITRGELAVMAKQLAVPVDDGDSLYKIMDNIYKKTARPKLIQPTFIVDYPADYLPLAKRKESDKNLVEAFQLVAGGTELVKAFSELNDPIDQRARFENQEKMLAGGERDAQRVDEDYIEAMEYGMPPAGGVGIGIDRLVMLLTNTKNIKEVILFPTMRPKQQSPSSESES